MSMEADSLQACSTCGASIYPEHLAKGIAARVAGNLLCIHCLADSRAAATAAAEVHDAASAATGSAAAATPSNRRPLGTAMHAHQYKRALAPDTSVATRCRTFHCKLADASIMHLDEQVNEWIDAHPDITIKFATSTVGTVEGKHPDPHLLVTLFY